MAKQRSPSYPGISLETAISRAKAFFNAEGKHETLVSTAVGHWKYGPKSSGGLVTISALKAYGLMEDRGNSLERKVRLSALGLSIVQDERQISPERDANIRKAALTPKILNDLWQRYGLTPPSNDTVSHFLKVEREFTATAAYDVIKIYEDAIKFAKLDDENSGDAVISEEPAIESFQDDQPSFTPEQLPAPANGFPNPPTMARPDTSKLVGDSYGEEIANIRVSRTTTIRLTANGPYSRQSIEALVAQLKLGLDLGTYDDLEDLDC
ncbi:hypothetical protein [Pseudomonas sp.]|jgi:hypothetical protein|uniref:hypothetical protein n=1 Tax=Pseudomonas sp. TaxID=306 RepID=UPI002EDB3030